MILTRNYLNYRSFAFSHNSSRVGLCATSLLIFSHEFSASTQSNNLSEKLIKTDELHMRVLRILMLKYIVLWSWQNHFLNKANLHEV